MQKRDACAIFPVTVTTYLLHRRKSWKSACQLRGRVCCWRVSLYRKTNWKISIKTLFQRVPTQCNVCRDCGQTSHTVFCGDLGCNPLVATGCCLPVFAFLMLAHTDFIEGKVINLSYLDLLLYVRNFLFLVLRISLQHR